MTLQMNMWQLSRTIVIGPVSLGVTLVEAAKLAWAYGYDFWMWWGQYVLRPRQRAESSGFAAVQYVVADAEQPEYTIFGPPLSSPVLIWAMFLSLMTVELAVGVLDFWGLVNRIQNRSAGSDEFHRATLKAILGASLGTVCAALYFFCIPEAIQPLM